MWPIMDSVLVVMAFKAVPNEALTNMLFILASYSLVSKYFEPNIMLVRWAILEGMVI